MRKFYILSGTFIILNMLDYLTTVYGLSIHLGYEANNFARFFLNHNLFWFLKLVVIGMTIGALYYLLKRTIYKKTILGFMGLANVATFAVVVNNVYFLNIVLTGK